MPRKARTRAESGIYHVMLRGINCQQIFEDEEDNEVFLKILRDYKPVCGYQLLAYCLMGNHVHLLIMGTLNVKETAKRICELPGNRDYGAFYDVDRLPSRQELIHALEKLPKELLYSDRASAIYRGLSMLGIHTKICR